MSLLRTQLDEYQLTAKRGALSALKKGIGYILALEMGMGKTIIALGVMAELSVAGVAGHDHLVAIAVHEAFDALI